MTIEISTLIAHYIAENTRLIIPGIGTLLRRKESGEIVFMEMLKKGDGVLNSLVGTHFNLSDTEAAATVENYAVAIKRALESSKKFIMDGVGVLMVGANGGVEFIFNPYAHSIDAEIERPKTIVEVEPMEVATEEKQVAEALPEEPAQGEEEPVAKGVEREESVVAEESPKEVAPQTKASRVSALYDEEEDEVEAKEGNKAFDLSGVADKFRAITKKPTSSKPAKQRKKIKLDGITILAIVSGLIAIGTLIWGMIPSQAPLDIDTPVEIVEE